jgi:hypothetical protein
MFFISYLPIRIDDILDDRKNTAHQKCNKQNADEQKYNKQKNSADYFNHLCFSFLLGDPLSAACKTISPEGFVAV